MSPNAEGLDHHSLQVLNNEGRSTATTVADTGAAVPGLLLLQDRGEGCEDTGARGTERVADGNRATEDVDALGVEAEDLNVGQGNNGESLVDLVEVNVLLGQTSVLDGLGDGQGRGSGEALGLMGGIGPANDLGKGLDTELLKLALRDEDNSGSTVVDGRSVGGSDGAVGDEDSAGSLELVDVQVLDLLVLVDGDSRLAAATADLDRSDLGEETGGGRGLSLLVGVDGILVLLLTGDAVLLAAELSLHAHKLLLSVCVPKTIRLDSIDEASLAILDTSAEVGEVVGGVGHALSAASDNDVRTAGDNSLCAKDHGLQAGSANLVDGGADDLVGEAGIDGALTGRGLANTGGAVMSVHAYIVPCGWEVGKDSDRWDH